jgi:triacylglycerol esterase/lipase EstA (alpha/beta hydrolase family)
MAALAACGVIGLATTTTAAARAASDYPVVYNWPAAIAASEVQPTPPGANDWTCRPSAEHPLPVVLVPGLTGNGGRDYYAAAPLLANHGYCVFMFDYRDRGQESIEDAAAELSPFIDRVLSTTGAARVDVVGHSQGGMMPRYYMKFLGGAAKVHALVGISPINHGTTLFGVATLSDQSTTAQACPACAEDVAGSDFMQRLNAGGDTLPGVRYTVIGTRYEDIISPYGSQFLSGRAVTNILLQDQCATDFVDHLASSYDSVALHDVLNALDPAHATRPTCTLVLPGVGG